MHFKITKRLYSIGAFVLCAANLSAADMTEGLKISDGLSLGTEFTASRSLSLNEYIDMQAPIEPAASGDIVESPDVVLGLPGYNYVEVSDMNTSGLGTSQDSANIISNLQDSLVSFTDKNDMMYWFVTEGANVLHCSPNGFRCEYVMPGNKKFRPSVVMAVWLPQEAKEISVQFQSYSKGLSLSIWTYDYTTDTMLLHNAGNNIFSNPQAPGEAITYSQTYTSQSVTGTYSGQYLLLMFNSSEGEKTWLDINGTGSDNGLIVAYEAEDPEETPKQNPWQRSGGPIPEPATVTLSLLALAGLAARRRRR
ncbi:MAG: PEP-CTERM sorting domain-containing protein [Akkermansia sp.]|nr:PEP-CTERM sorting domain-containing protein [Akkermansia sp.]